MKKMRYFIALIILLAFAGCATQTGLYYYGDYSYKYYKMVKKQDEASKTNFIKSMDNVITKSTTQYKTPVPPGIYCDYGMMKASQSNIEEAHKYFNLEKSQWPESAPLMDYLIQFYK
jgi:hypothetical protein